jgi:circadian clock protein KaiC
MKSIGINLEPYIKANLLYIHASRPSLQGLELHLLLIHKLLDRFKAKTVIIDPISSLITIGSSSEVRAMLVRLIDMMKVKQITALLTALTHLENKEYGDITVDAVSSLADTWIRVRNEEHDQKRRRSLFIVKSRGMGHSNDLWNYVITNKGLQISDKENEAVTKV